MAEARKGAGPDAYGRWYNVSLVSSCRDTEDAYTFVLGLQP